MYLSTTTGKFKASWRNDQNPSLSLYQSDTGRWLWKDFGTDQGGNAYQFARQILELSHGEAVDELERFAQESGDGNKQDEEDELDIVTEADGAEDAEALTEKAAKGNRAGLASVTTPSRKGRIAATYDYTDASGTLLYQVVRKDPKGFMQRRPDGKGGWVYDLKGVTPVLYQLPKVTEAVQNGEPVYIVEGEKDALSLEALGLTATCNPMGAGKWHDAYSETLENADVVIIPDNDAAGRDHAERVARSLEDKAKSICVVVLPGLADKGDVSDWLEAGGTLEQLEQLVQDGGAYRRDGDGPLETYLRIALDKDLEPDWPDEPQPLAPKTPPVPDLEPAMLPGPLRGWLVDAAERMCVNLVFVAVAALVALGAVIGRKLGIHPKAKDDWWVPANLWGGLVGLPGSLKTPAISEGTSPLKHLAARARQEFEAAQAEHAARVTIVKGEIEALKKQSKEENANLKAIEAKLADKYAELENMRLVERRYLINDATVEVIGVLLKDNPEGLLYLRDEVIGLLRSLDKPGREGDRAFLLESWNGTGSFVSDRIARGTLHVEALILSILGGIQPGPLMDYVEGAIGGEKEADGLLQRFQLLVWPDRPPPWQRVDRYPDAVAKNRAFEVFEKLDGLTPEDVDVEPDIMSAGSVPALRFSSEAQEEFNAWLDGLMERLRGSEFEKTPAFAAHLAKYPSLMPKLALIFHLVNVVGDDAFEGVSLEEVSVEAARLAIRWCGFLEAHARKVYAAELRAEAQLAEALAYRIKAGEVKDSDTLRDIYRKHWSSLDTPEKVEAATKALEKLGWLRLEKVKTKGAPKLVIRLHPRLRGEG